MDPAYRNTGEADLWRQYRLAFEHFSGMARTVQNLKAEAGANPARVEEALLELERARVHHNQCRDILAYSLLLPPHVKQTQPRLNSKPEYSARVKQIAEMLWELEGRHDGRADEHWFRAERIVQCTLAS